MSIKWMKSLVAIAVLAVSFVLLFRHLGNLDYSKKPSSVQLSDELKLISNQLHAVLASPVITLDKGVYSSAETNISYSNKNDTTKNVTQKMQAIGWHEVGVKYGHFQRFCRDDVVAEIEIPSDAGLHDKAYFLRATWGNADALCH